MSSRRWLISASQLACAIQNRAENVRVLDGSWYLGDRSGKAEFAERRIPGAAFFDLEEVCDKNSSLPHMAPSASVFQAAIRSMGVNKGDQVVAYDGVGFFSAPRLWWMFKYFGYDNVKILDGGFSMWEREHADLIERGPPTTHAEGNVRQCDYSAVNGCVVVGKHPNYAVHEVRPELRTSLEEVMNIVNSKSSHHQLVDARPEGRFDGSTPEPRPGIRSGHIPGSVNVCFKLLQHDDGTMKSDDDLRSVFEAAGVDMNGEKVIVTTCGSGVSAAVDYLALSVLGISNPLSLYDGSWTEYASDESRPREPPNGAIKN